MLRQNLQAIDWEEGQAVHKPEGASCLNGAAMGG